MLKAYIAERNYIFLYLYNMFYRASTTIVHVFTGAFMVNSGMPLWMVLAFYAITAFLAGSLAPVGLMVITKLGVPKTALVSLLLRTGFFCIFIATVGDIFWLLIAVVLYGLSYAVYPFKQVATAVYVTKDKYRGRQITMGFVLAGFMSAIAVATAGYFLIKVGYLGVAVLSSLFYVCAVLMLNFMTSTPFHVDDYRIRDGYKFVKSSHLRGMHIPLVSEQLVMSAGLIIPVYLFTVIGDLSTFGAVATAAVVLEVLVTLVFGQVIDRTKNLNALNYGSLMMASSFVLMMCVSSPVTAVLADSFSKISRNSFSASFRTALHKLVRMGKSKQLLMQGTAWQLTAGICETIFLGLLAFIAWKWGSIMFVVAFVICALGALSTALFFSKKYSKERFK